MALYKQPVVDTAVNR